MGYKLSQVEIETSPYLSSIFTQRVQLQASGGLVKFCFPEIWDTMARDMQCRIGHDEGPKPFSAVPLTRDVEVPTHFDTVKK